MSARVNGSGREQISLVSRCVESALETALRRAFEVALEIALNEISRLTAGQALLDVCCEHFRERQRENSSLKLPPQHLSHGESNQSSLYSRREDTPRKVCEKQERGGEVDEYVDESESLDGSFHKISQGLVRSHEMNTSPINEQDTSDQKELNIDHIQDVEPSDQDLSFQPAIDQVMVKSEKPDSEEPALNRSSRCGSPYPSPDYSFDPTCNEEFVHNRMTLVQSKLLEDWRPDPEKPQKETEPLDQEPSHSHGSSKINLPSSSCVSPVSTQFHNLYLSADDRTSLMQSTQHCIEQHRTILMSVEEGTVATRPRKQQLFPPGCSPYHCSMCSRDFNRLENLKTHLRIHTGERPYSCSLCGVRFRHSGALTRHFRIHTGEKPYVCGECGKSFRNCGGLRYHQKSHHPSTAFKTSHI
ncbi:hypothetical protein ABG768_025434 [Culter alburnus]|uniref:C2H2-type domain-containing protein n=1 Tax=Culter alburnus TaxID=194366 RepID=A0AAW2AGE7_CULAL